MKKILISGLIISLFSSLFASQVVKGEGDILVNGEKLTKSRVIKIGDFIETKKNSKIKFNIGVDAFMAKANSKFKLEKDGEIKTLNVIAGGVLAVFKKGVGKHEIKTPNMTAGIRGTGIYVQIVDNKTYFCTCYGKTELKTEHDHKELEATHHNMVWVKDGKVKQTMDNLGHIDDDLRELEAMVGRVPAFDLK